MAVIENGVLGDGNNPRRSMAPREHRIWCDEHVYQQDIVTLPLSLILQHITLVLLWDAVWNVFPPNAARHMETACRLYHKLLTHCAGAAPITCRRPHKRFIPVKQELQVFVNVRMLWLSRRQSLILSAYLNKSKLSVQKPFLCPYRSLQVDSN